MNIFLSSNFNFSGRMEKENDRMLQDEEQLAEKRLKLDYHDLKTSDQVIFDTWECILSSPEDQVGCSGFLIMENRDW